MLQTNGNNMEEGMRKRIMGKIARLRKLPDLAKELEEYEPQPDPIQQEMAQLSLEKVKAEIEEIRSRAAENYSETALDQAKARLLSSQADSTDLDFVEQESGVKQERDKELQGAQAAANMERDVKKNSMEINKERMTKINEYLTRGKETSDK